MIYLIHTDNYGGLVDDCQNEYEAKRKFRAYLTERMQGSSCDDDCIDYEMEQASVTKVTFAHGPVFDFDEVYDEQDVYPTVKE